VARNGVLMHVHKCGGQSLKQMLFFSGSPVRARCFTLVGPQHRKGQRYRPKYRWEIPDWHARFKFAIIRNPFARLPSLYRHVTLHGFRHDKQQYKFQGSFKDMLKVVFDRRQPFDPAFHANPFNLNAFIRVHASPLLSEGYYLQTMDYIGRYEDGHENCVKHIFEQLGAELPPLAHENHTSHADTPHYSTYYDHEDRELAEHYYWGDCEVYDYKFEESA